MHLRFPFVKITLLLTAGILLQKWIAFPFWFPLVFLIFFIITSLLTFSKPIPPVKSIIISVLLSALIIGIGYYSAVLKFGSYSFYPDRIYKQSDITFYGKVGTINLVNKKGYTFEFFSDSAVINQKSIHKTAKLIGNVKREYLLNDFKNKDFNKLYNSISAGDYVKIKGLFIKGREARNPGEFDYNDFLHNKGISGIVNIFSKDDIKILNKNSNNIDNFFKTIRQSISSKLNLLHDFQTSSLLKGLVLADRSDIDEDVKTEFINSGVVHVLAVSGLHVVFIVLIIVLLCGRFNLWIRFIVISTGVLFYMLLTGAPSSVVRASLMSVIVLLGFVSNRDTNLLNTIAISAFIILIVSPEEIYNPGFLLSYAAVISIALVYPVFIKTEFIRNINNKMVKGFLLFVILSFCAQLGTLPFILLYFGKISLTSLPSNIMIVPLTSLILGNGIFTIILSYIYLPLAIYPALTSKLMMGLLFSLTHTFGGEYSFITVYRFTWINFLIFYFFLGVFIYWFPRFLSWKSKVLLMIMILLNLLSFFWLKNNQFVRRNELTVMAIDVGQGDSFMVHFPNNKYALIDAGAATLNYDCGERNVLPVINFYDIPKIDYAFISHMDKDHFAGMLYLLYMNKIVKLYKPAPNENDSISAKFDKFCRSRNVHVEYYSKKILSIGNTRVYMLNDSCFSNNNDDSGILKLVYGRTSFLFTGDESKTGEKYYLKYGEFLNSSVLKVSHHGSKTATSKIFLDKVRPQYSIISAGIKNRYKHPAPEILTRLRVSKSKVLRTDLSGAILLKSNGEDVTPISLEL